MKLEDHLRRVLAPALDGSDCCGVRARELMLRGPLDVAVGEIADAVRNNHELRMALLEELAEDGQPDRRGRNVISGASSPAGMVTTSAPTSGEVGRGA